MSKPRDVVVVRVSEKFDREDEHFHSPEVQIEAASRWAKNRGERFAASPIPEIDVSGKLPLSKRPGLLAALEMIEADQLVVPYFDGLVRSLKVRLEVIERVERAAGEIFALDPGKLTNGTATQRPSTNKLGSVFTDVSNSDSGSYRCGDTSANRCRRRAAVMADRVEEIVLGRGPGVLAHGRRAPTRLAQAATPRGGRGDRARQRGSR